MAAEKMGVHGEFYEFLLSAPTPEQVMAFRPSDATQTRIRYLLDENKTRKLDEHEESELDEFGKVEHLVRMLKIHAYAKLNNKTL